VSGALTQWTRACLCVQAHQMKLSWFRELRRLWIATVHMVDTDGLASLVQGKYI
jgi:hypothetical protein